MTLHEVSEASTIVQEAADPEANILFGTVIDDSLGDSIKITVIATGFHSDPPIVQPEVVRAEETAVPVRAPRASVPEHPILESDAAQRTKVLRGLRGGPGRFGNDEGGYGPHYKGVREDVLDVPTFIRKQMD